KHLSPRISHGNQITYDKEQHNGTNPTSWAAALHLRTDCSRITGRHYRCNVCDSRRRQRKGHARVRTRPSKCSGEEHQGGTGRIWSWRFVASPYASKVSFHLCDGFGGSHPKFGQ